MRRQLDHSYEFGPFRLDISERVVLRDGEIVPLTTKAFETLRVLLENRGHIVEREELMERVWPGTFVEEGNLSVTVSMLRKALGDSSNEPCYIATIPGRGYRFIAGVRQTQLETVDLIVEKQTRSLVVIEEEEEENNELLRDLSSDLLPTSQHERGKALGQAESVSAIPATAAYPEQPANSFLRPAALVALALIIGAGLWFIARLIATTPLPTSKLVPLTSLPGSESQAAFSPDGKQIAFVWNGEKENNFDIYVKLLDTEIPLRLTTDPAQDSNPVWSPDGRYIAFLRRLAEKSAVYLIPPLGGPERKLAEVNAINYGSSLDWSPDGKSLAAVDRCGSQEPCSLSLISIETGEKQKLTFPPTEHAEYNGDTNPAFSPDGKTLAFIRIGSLGVSDVYLAPVSGGEPRRLTFDNMTAIGLTWTADGREIIFRSNRGGYPTLWRIPAVGGTPELLPAVGDEAIEPAISHQGQRLVYTRRMMDSNIWRIEMSSPTTRGTSPARLISSTRNDVAPQLSPDGKRIVFASDRAGSLEIWVCDSEGLNPIQLTFFGGVHTGTPRWSPDSRRITFDSRPEGQTDIYVISAEGGKPRRVTMETSEDVAPSWSRDGRWIYFGSKRSGDWQVWKVPPEGGAAVQVTKEGGFAALESPDGKFIYYAKNRDLPGPLWRVPIKGGEESPVPGFANAVPWGQWAVLDKGIYFITAETRATIEFFNFATRQITQIATPEKKVFGGPSLSVSADGGWILYVQIDRNDSDLMLVENFR